MTITPINAAATAFLAGSDTADKLVMGAPNEVLGRLLRIQAKTGAVPRADYEEASRTLGISVRQIQRHLAGLREGRRPPGRQPFVLTTHHEQVILACNGNVALAYRELKKAGEDLPGEDTFWRAWYCQPMAKQDYARHGAKGLVEFLLYPPWEAPERNSVWQADHFELPIDVIADGCTTQTVKPWLTVFEDDRSRLVLAATLTATAGRRPDADIVCATLVAGIRTRMEGGVEVGGVPRIVRWDNAAEFNAGMVIDLGVRVGFECHAVPPYSGHMKGKVERFGRRVQEQFCVLQPGFTHGPKTHTTKDPFRDTTPLTAAELRPRLGLWIAEYNSTHHQGIGETPLERWASDQTPLRRASPTQLRSALLVAPRAYKVEKRRGIWFRGGYWQSGSLMDLVGRTVEVHYPVGTDIDFIEVYKEGKWQCTAWPAAKLTDSQRREIFDGRRDLYTEVRELHEQAKRIRTGADAQMGDTDATPAIASMPAVDPLAPNTGDLYDLLRRAAASPDDITDEDHRDAEEGS